MSFVGLKVGPAIVLPVQTQAERPVLHSQHGATVMSMLPSQTDNRCIRDEPARACSPERSSTLAASHHAKSKGQDKLTLQ